MIFLKKYYVNTTDQWDCLPITHEVRYAIRDANVPAGLVTVLVAGPGASVTLGEGLPEVVAGLRGVLKRWGEPAQGGKAKDQWRQPMDVEPRVLAALLGRSVQIPFDNGRLCLDPYSDVLLCDFETKGRRREFVVQVMGEAAESGKTAPPPPEEDYE
ncbi:MAG: YjbQ family protein [Deltaproteobacteria bacterium]|nr:YjbQ family protein [Deltaproteobacteria bacterium]